MAIQCAIKQLCENNQLLEEKVLQNEEIILQQAANCEKLEAILDPDAVCPECLPTSHTFRFQAFDSDNGVYENGEYQSGVFDTAFVHTTTVNGVAVTTPFDPATMLNKSQVYADTQAAVNALPGTSLVVVTDRLVADQGRVEYDVTIPAGETLTIVNTHNGNVFEFIGNEDGTCTGTFKDSEGNDIESGAPVEQ